MRGAELSGFERVPTQPVVRRRLGLGIALREQDRALPEGASFVAARLTGNLRRRCLGRQSSGRRVVIVVKEEEVVSECVIAGHEVRVGAQRRAERLRGGHRLAVVLEGHSEAVVRQREGGILLGRFLKAGNGAGETVVRLGIGFVPSLEVAPGFESLAERLKRIPRRRHKSEEHTSELQSPYDLVCRLLLEKK